MKNLAKFIVIFACFVLVADFSSAIISKEIVIDEQKQTQKQDTETKYGTVILKERAWYDIFGWYEREVKRLTLEENTPSCSNDCLALINIELKEKGKLVEGVYFRRSFDNKKTWVDWNSFFNWNIYVEEDADIYEGRCNDRYEYDEKNNSYVNYPECDSVVVGSEKRFNLLDFNKEYDAGIYKVKLTGSKKPDVIYDWVIKTSGVMINDWAVWGNISEGDEAEVNLISPGNNEVVYFNPVSFVSFANVTNGAYLVNVTLYTNETGNWEISRQIELRRFYDGLISHYSLDETSGNIAYDTFGKFNLSIGSAVQMNKIGKLNKAFNFTNSSNSFLYSSTLSARNITTYVMWIYPHDVTSRNQLIGTPSNNSGILQVQLQSNKLYVEIHSGASADIKYTTNNVFSSPNQWYFIVLSIIGSNVNVSVNGQYQPMTGTGTRNLSLAPPGIYFGKEVTSSSNYFFGMIDEISLYNRTLTYDEIQSKLTYGYNRTFTKEYLRDQIISWNVKYCDSDGDCGFALQNWTFRTDNVAPNIYFNYSDYIIPYARAGQNLTIGIKATDVNLDKVWYNYDGTNKTINGPVSGIWNFTNVTLTAKKNITICANDSMSNINCTTFFLNYHVFENNRSFNSLTFETKNETFRINLDLYENYNVAFNYGEFDYQTIKIGNDYYTTINSELVNANTAKYFFWKINNTINTYTSNITIRDFFVNYTAPKQFINVTIRDEYDGKIINNTYIEPNFIYYISKGQNFLAFTNNTFAPLGNFAISTNPDISNNLTIDGKIYYYSGGYNPRFYYIDEQTFPNNTLTNLTFYLLLLSDGIVVRYRILDNNMQPIVGARIRAEKQAGASYILVEQTITDDSGEASLFLNPNAYHRITVRHPGCTEISETRRITSSDVIVKVMSCQLSSTNGTNIFDLDRLNKISFALYPGIGTVFYNLFNSSTHHKSFGFYARDNNCNITKIKYELHGDATNIINFEDTANKCHINYTEQVNISGIKRLHANLTIYLENDKYYGVSQTYYIFDSSSYSNFSNLNDALRRIKENPLLFEKVGISESSRSLIIFLLLLGLILVYNYTRQESEIVLSILFTFVVGILSYYSLLNVNLPVGGIFFIRQEVISQWGLFIVSLIYTTAVVIDGTRR